MDKEGVNNLIFVEKNLIKKLQLGRVFNTREEAEKFAVLLNEKGLFKRVYCKELNRRLNVV